MLSIIQTILCQTDVTYFLFQTSLKQFYRDALN